MQLPIIRYRNLWFAFSAVLVAAAAAGLLMYGLKFGIDFTGGSLLEVKFAGSVPQISDINAKFEEFGVKDAVIQTVGDNGAIARMSDLNEQAHTELLGRLEQAYPGLTEQRFETVGPTVGDELRRSAMWSLALVLMAIALYIAYAFRKVNRPVASWKYGVVTLVTSVLHDVLIPVGVFAYLGKYLNVEMNSSLVAALLTILGFSVHDTVVVCDRIRENLLRTGGKFEEIVERSVNETLSRSINTTMTAFLPLLAIFVYGGLSLKWFALALIIGLVSGTYSSIFLVAPLLVVMEKGQSAARR